MENFISYWSKKSTEKGPSSSPKGTFRGGTLAAFIGTQRLKLCANQHVVPRGGGYVPATKPSLDLLHAVLLPNINLHYRSHDNQLRATTLK